MVSYPIDQGVKKVYYWAARSTGGEFTPGREVDELVWLPVADGQGQTQLPARSKDVAPLRETARRHSHRARGPARHRWPKITFQRRRHQTAAGQAGTRAGGGTGSAAAGVRRHRRVRGRPAPLSPDGRTARRGTGRDDPQRARPDRGVVRQESQARPPPAAAHRRGERHTRDLHAGQGDSGPDRLVVRTRRSASPTNPATTRAVRGCCPCPAAGWWRPTTSAARWPPTCGPDTQIPFAVASLPPKGIRVKLPTGDRAARWPSWQEPCWPASLKRPSWPEPWSLPSWPEPSWPAALVAAFLAGAFLAAAFLAGAFLAAAFLAGAFLAASLLGRRLLGRSLLGRSLGSRPSWPEPSSPPSWLRRLLQHHVSLQVLPPGGAVRQTQPL